ncbi:MAG: dipicolinate synthase subunit B [Firmicutes bacterium HGW-Firmicutes-1]|jgi:dipicolinate synthase subunit B|nr:MAG: dipicolinate synthase subunit B [Firmicutes bacterium HGW-Firmicutes-1]
MDLLKNIKIGYAISGSFCTFKSIIEPIKKLIEEGAEVFPIMSEHASTIDTRFGQAKEFVSLLEKLTGNSVQTKIEETELIGPDNPYDALIVAPCTGNTFAKLANAITDTSVLMAIKATLRNNIPVILGIASNDALGLNMKNLGILMNTPNIYFVPFGQDNFKTKKNSLVARMDLIFDTLMSALNGKQIQPILITYKKE